MEWGRSVVNLVRARELPRRYDGTGKTEAVEIWESRALQPEPCLGLTYHKYIYNFREVLLIMIDWLVDDRVIFGAPPWIAADMLLRRAWPCQWLG